MCCEGRPTNCSNLQRWRQNLLLILPEVKRFKTRRAMQPVAEIYPKYESLSELLRWVSVSNPTHRLLSDGTWNLPTATSQKARDTPHSTYTSLPDLQFTILIHRPITITANCVGKVEGNRQSPLYLSTTPRRRMREWRYSSIIPDLGTRWRWVVSFTSQPLWPRGKCPRYPLDRRLGGPQNRSGRYGV
jgi:hypothetical protein